MGVNCVRLPEMSSPGVYRIFNKVTKRNYIGSSSRNWKNRRNAHVHFLRKGNHQSKKMQADWHTHGPDSFMFFCICECPPERVLDMEEAAMKEWKALDPELGYNKKPITGPRYRGGRPKGEDKIRFSRMVTGEQAKRLAEMLRMDADQLVQLEHGKNRGWLAERSDKPRLVTGMREPSIEQDLDEWSENMAARREKHPLVAMEAHRAKGYVVSVVPKVSDAEHEKLKREVEELRASNKILVAMSSPDAEKDAKIVDLEDRLQKTARMTDDQKCRAWIRKYDELKAAWDAKFGASEFAQ